MLKGGSENIVPGISTNNNEFVSRASTSHGHFADDKGCNKAENNIDSAARGHKGIDLGGLWKTKRRNAQRAGEKYVEHNVIETLTAMP